MAKQKEPFTFVSNLDKIVPKIQEAPEKVLRVIGQNLVREIRPQTPKRTGRLAKSLSYSLNRKMYKESVGEWPPSRTPFLMIGYKLFYAPFIFRKEPDPIEPVVRKNADLIKEMINEAVKEIGKE